MSKESFTPMAEITGLKPRNRLYRLGQKRFGYPRTTRIIVGLNEFGDTVVYSLGELKKMKGRINTSAYPHLLRGAEKYLGSPFQRRSFPAVYRKRTTTGGFKIRESGFRQQKIGFGSVYELKKIRRLRKEAEFERFLLQAGINEHQLFLLKYLPFNSPPKELSIKPLPGYKKGGMFPKEFKEIERQRRRNKRLLARQGNIYKRY
jgi:hypothetical protein